MNFRESASPRPVPSAVLSSMRAVPTGVQAVPVLTVYYLGVLDTTPEFASEAALEAYLARPRTSGP